MKILLKGYFGVPNFGDDILLKTVYSCIREAVPEIIIGVTVQRDARYLCHLLDESVVAVDPKNDSDAWPLVVYAGGGQFFGYRRHSAKAAVLQMCLRTVGVKNLLGLLGASRNHAVGMAFEGGPPRITAGIGLGVGPFVWGSASEFAAAKKLASCSFLHVRDKYSLELVRRWRMTVSNTNLVDLAFATRRWRQEEQSDKRVSPYKDVGVVLGHSGYQGKEGWKAGLRAAIDVMRRQGLSVDVISLCEVEDRLAIKDVAGTETVLGYDPSKSSLEAFTRLLSSYRVLVSGRAHGILLSFILGIPCVAIVKEEKLRWAAECTSPLTYEWTAPFETETLLQSIARAISIDVNRRLEGIERAENMRLMAEAVLEQFQDCIVRACKKHGSGWN